MRLEYLDDAAPVLSECRVFGQRDHVRRYGPDVRGRMEEAGFVVDVITTEDAATAEQARRMGLMTGDCVYLCRKG